jgi:hypothetical protein
MDELIGLVSNVISILGEAFGVVSDEGPVLRRGKVGRRRVYTSQGLNRSRSGGKSSKEDKILISGNNSICVGKKY